jgi:hypothetical protein
LQDLQLVPFDVEPEQAGRRGIEASVIGERVEGGEQNADRARRLFFALDDQAVFRPKVRTQLEVGGPDPTGDGDVEVRILASRSLAARLTRMRR